MLEMERVLICRTRLVTMVPGLEDEAAPKHSHKSQVVVLKQPRSVGEAGKISGAKDGAVNGNFILRRWSVGEGKWRIVLSHIGGSETEFKLRWPLCILHFHRGGTHRL